jgi:hypothetical protein
VRANGRAANGRHGDTALSAGGEPLWNDPLRSRLFVSTLGTVVKRSNKRLPRIARRDAYTSRREVRVDVVDGVDLVESRDQPPVHQVHSVD